MHKLNWSVFTLWSFRPASVLPECGHGTVLLTLTKAWEVKWKVWQGRKTRRRKKLCVREAGIKRGEGIKSLKKVVIPCSYNSTNLFWYWLSSAREGTWSNRRCTADISRFFLAWKDHLVHKILKRYLKQDFFIRLKEYMYFLITFLLSPHLLSTALGQTNRS